MSSYTQNVIEPQCAVMDVWHKYVTRSDMSDSETMIITDMDEPLPLPENTELILMLTYDESEPGATK